MGDHDAKKKLKDSMNTILVPVDFSKAAENAFQYALRIANLFHARMMVFHVYQVAIPEPYMIPITPDPILQAEEDRIQERFDEMERSVPPSIAKNIELEFNMSLGAPTDEILHLCDSLEPSLVVMGMKRSQDLTRAIMGSVCTHLIQRIGQPILIIPENATYKGIRSIAYATNFAEDDARTIEELMEFAFLYDAMIHCIHIRTEQENENISSREDALHERFKDDLIMHSVDFENEDDQEILEGINHYIDKHDVDMIAMLTHKRNFWGRLVHHSNCKEMALHTDLPILVFRMSN